MSRTWKFETPLSYESDEFDTCAEAMAACEAQHVAAVLAMLEVVE